MTTDFASLKNKNGLNKLQKKIESETKGSFEKDPTEWQCTLDKAGNGSATLRFLPAPPQDGEDGTPWVKLFRHGFEGPGGWYVENSLTTLNKKDPVQEYNNKLWKKGDIETARIQKRKLTYISNIYVISDPGTPENEGKVFKFRYGVKIFNKLRNEMGYDEKGEIIEERDPDEPVYDPFDFYTGANFKLKVKKITVGTQSFPNYDDSKFSPQSALLGGDDSKLEEIWKQEHSLLAEIAPDKFKIYAELEERFLKIINKSGDSLPAKRAETAQPKLDDPKSSNDDPKSSNDDVDVPWKTDQEDDKDGKTMDYFKRLAMEE